MEYTIQEYSETAAGLARLKERLKGVVYDVTTSEGMLSAKRDRKELVTLRTTLEAKRKEIKAPVIEKGKTIDLEAERIRLELVALEEPIDKQIKAEEKKQELIEQAAAEAKRKRQEAIKERIARIEGQPLQAVNLKALGVAAIIEKLEALIITEEFEEWMPMAQTTKDESLSKLREIHNEKVALETEAVRLEAERAEQARIQAEKDKALEEEKEKLRLEREKFEKEQAESKRLQDEENARKQAVLDAERAELQKKQDEADAERKRKEAEAAEEERKRKEAADKEAERIQAEKLKEQEEAFKLRLQTPYEAITAILEIAESDLTDKQARQRIIQAAKMSLAGRGL